MVSTEVHGTPTSYLLGILIGIVSVLYGIGEVLRIALGEERWLLVGFLLAACGIGGGVGVLFKRRWGAVAVITMQVIGLIQVLFRFPWNSTEAIGGVIIGGFVVVVGAIYLVYFGRRWQMLL